MQTTFTDEQFALIEPLLPQNNRRGGKRLTDTRTSFDGILYILTTGCQWRQLPRKYGKWYTVYTRFRRWSES